MPEIGLFEAIYSARSLRRLKPDPVPEALITKILRKWQEMGSESISRLRNSRNQSLGKSTLTHFRAIDLS